MAINKNPKRCKCSLSKKVIKSKTINKEKSNPIFKKSKEYKETKSKFQLRTNIDTLIQRIQYKNELKQKQIQQQQYIGELRILINCTHKPKLFASPKYLNSMRHISPQLLININKGKTTTRNNINDKQIHH